MPVVAVEVVVAGIPEAVAGFPVAATNKTAIAEFLTKCTSTVLNLSKTDLVV